MGALRLTLIAVFSIFRYSKAVDTIGLNQVVRDGETLISAGGSFELGFFSPGNSKNQYLGIWFKKASSLTVVWVANRGIPVTDSSGVLKVTDQGTLVVLNGNDTILWSSNSSRSARNTTAQLLETGNLVVKDGDDDNPENFLWQSFDYPCNTLLPGMKFGKNRVTGLDQYLSAWKSSDDPSEGDFTYRLDPGGYPQLLLWQGSSVKFRTGPLNGVRFSGFPEMEHHSVYPYEFVSNEQELYFSYVPVNGSIISLVLNPQGSLGAIIWIDRITNDWNMYSSIPKDECDFYGLCGVYGSCNISRSPKCECMKGFVPKFQEDWDQADWSNGCVRSTPLDCPNGDGFEKFSAVKLPDTRNSWFNRSMSFNECEAMCLSNCSCSAYAYFDIRDGGSGCLFWFDDLIDITSLTGNEQEIYVRMAAAEVESDSSSDGSKENDSSSNGSKENDSSSDGSKENDSRSKGKKRKWVIVGSVSSMGIIVLSLFLTMYLLKTRRQRKKGTMAYNLEVGQKEDGHLQLFDFATVSKATDNFSFHNKLGQGGFGLVYKGTLQDGQEIGVKRLSKGSGQGLTEFKNEVIYIAKLQHRNLVRLLGCCIHDEEKMLIYEYMPNKSLDTFIFDKTRRMELDWNKCFFIINGIARGLLYLHQDSRLRIIHRDLKAGNILLDKEMVPKISDFGMARSFGGNETEANTKRVVGTYGYMSPEYAIDGVYSIKSDVFSFGVLVLEIVSGKKNRGFSHPDHSLNLLGHAWTLYVEGRSMELIDSSVGDIHNLSEVLRSINVGLLCVQCSPDDRPSMSSVVLMLSSDGALPQPKEPGFFIGREAKSSSDNQGPCSGSGLTITTLDGR